MGQSEFYCSCWWCPRSPGTGYCPLIVQAVSWSWPTGGLGWALVIFLGGLKEVSQNGCQAAAGSSWGLGAWYQPVWWVCILGKLVVGHDVSQNWFKHISGQCWGPMSSRAVTCLLQSKRVPVSHASLLLGGAGSQSFWVVQWDLWLPLACQWIQLYPCMAPRARANWLVGRVMSNINKLQGVLQNGAFQHLFPHGRSTTSKLLPPASMSPG